MGDSKNNKVIIKFGNGLSLEIQFRIEMRLVSFSISRMLLLDNYPT